MLENMSNYELNYWLVLQAIDPVGEQRADLREAIGISAIVNTQVTKKKHLTKPSDFLTGELLRKQHDKRLIERGLKPAWNAKDWWAKLTGKVKKG